jgi:hypothetical protein
MMLAIAALVFAGAAAGAQAVRVEKGQLVTDPADPAVVRFSVEITEPGSYQVRLLVRGESERKNQLKLTLRPEAGGPARTVHFTFTGRGCG